MKTFIETIKTLEERKQERERGVIAARQPPRRSVRATETEMNCLSLTIKQTEEMSPDGVSAAPVNTVNEKTLEGR